MRRKKHKELTNAFEQLTEWLKGVFVDQLESTSKEMMNIGGESRARTIGQIDEGSL